ncbi:MAG: PorV/PorQ family protein [Bacteroidota bacterium]
MKHILLLTFGLTLGISAWAQSTDHRIGTAVPFLQSYNEITGAGMGMIGVVAAPYNYSAAMNLNPALLAREQELIGGSIIYSPWGRSIGFPDRSVIDLNVYANKGRWGFGLNARRFNWGRNQLITRLGTPIDIERPQDNRLSGNIAYRITPKLSVGLGLQWFESEFSFFLTEDDYAKVISFAANLGLLYQSHQALNDKFRLKHNYAMSLTNLGPKISYPQPMPVATFIPANLALGVMEGLEYQYKAEHLLSVDLAIQAQKLLVPSEGGQSELAFLPGMLTSFTDASRQEELRSINWHFGAEARIHAPKQLIVAWRAGYSRGPSALIDQSLLTFGASAGLAGFRLDMSYLAPIGHNHQFQNTVRFGLSYQYKI